MTRIGRDHGRFLSEVMLLDMSEIAWYEAVYRAEHEASEKARAKASNKG